MPMPIPGPGRNTKLTPELTDKLCAKLRKCLPIEKACALVGIDEKTWRNWIERGEAGEENFEAFFRAVTHARAEAQEIWLDILRDCSIDKGMNPNPAMFVLERSDRENWGRQKEAKVENSQADAKGLKTCLQVKMEINSEEI